ncbi:ferredoxin [Novosphingobium flavum]|uniref:Ferredoxin n=1 Tax=Novosphingobium aerophilum TaxID=2839843 RepID=A0A7X1F9E2_9SPHN|nr:ferredoxin [Novosphingobium aerophilum]MBC2652817.1 ferredoxin [Novosphingobium aerophilum]MBC2662487.1 ferredoxin [Novosphingobium aerophilum]
MKVRVNPEICAGFGICTGIAPHVFELHDDGYAVAVLDDIAPEDQDLMLRAESQCPARAIAILED